MKNDQLMAEIPSHVDPALVVDFDFHHPEGIEHSDVFRAFAKLHQGPDISWTPHHGGHWILTRAEDIKWAQENWEFLSNTEKSVPKGLMPHMPPITCDPPDHSPYRALFNRYFLKRVIEEKYQPLSRRIIVELIEAIRPNGACEFVSEFSFVAPLRIFFDFVNLPYDRRDEFLSWGRQVGHGAYEDRIKAHQAIRNYLGELLDERLENPGDDIFTGISQWRDHPRYQHRDEIVGMAELVFLGGQDTVASQMGFSMQRLAERPELQQRLKDDPEIIPAAVEELIRRHGLSNSGRLVVRDVQRKGAYLKAGDMVLVMNSLSGIDDRMYAAPFTVDFDRGAPSHNSFGNGPHKCVGQHLARMEMRVFLEEWSRRMPIVALDANRLAPANHGGGVIGMDHLHLSWDT